MADSKSQDQPAGAQQQGEHVVDGSPLSASAAAGAKCTPPAKKRKAGRPPLKVRPGELDRIRELSAEGYTEIAISYRLGRARNFIQKMKKRDPRVEQALFEGREKEHTKLRTVLIEKAMAGDPVCLLFALKSRHGYKEAQFDRDSAPPLAVNISLPGAMHTDQYRRLFEVDVTPSRPALEQRDGDGDGD